MLTIKAHFDGKVLVPDEPIELPRNQAVRLHVDPIEPEPFDFNGWVGIANDGPSNPNPRFKSDEDLWKKG